MIRLTALRKSVSAIFWLVRVVKVTSGAEVMVLLQPIKISNNSNKPNFRYVVFMGFDGLNVWGWQQNNIANLKNHNNSGLLLSERQKPEWEFDPYLEFSELKAARSL
jgi:hypothetical protein